MAQKGWCGFSGWSEHPGGSGREDLGLRALARSTQPALLCLLPPFLPTDVNNFLCRPPVPLSGWPGCHGNGILLGLGVERAGSGGEEMMRGTWGSACPLVPAFAVPTLAAAPLCLGTCVAWQPPSAMSSPGSPLWSLGLSLELQPSSACSCPLWAGCLCTPQARPHLLPLRGPGEAWPGQALSLHQAAGAGVRLIPVSVAAAPDPVQNPPPSAHLPSSLPWPRGHQFPPCWFSPSRLSLPSPHLPSTKKKPGRP